MKKNLWVLSVAVFVVIVMYFGVGDVMAAWIPKATSAASTADTVAMKAQMTAKIKAALTGKEWTVYIVKTGATAKSPAIYETDVLTFTDRTVVSKNLVANKYSNGSNYALRVGSDGLSVWETMQMHENGKDLVFLRGELPKDCSSMTGAMIYQSPKGSEKTEIFSTSAPGAYQPPVIATTTTTTTATTVEGVAAVTPVEGAAATTVTATGGDTTTTVTTTSGGKASTRKNRR